jgi:hypothetical protein
MMVRKQSKCLGLLGVAILFAGLLGGCSSAGYKLDGEITGMVTIDGQPVTAGTVVFISENDQYSAAAPINEYGKYTMKEPPLGKCFVLVQTANKRGSIRPKTNPTGGEGDDTGSRGMILPPPEEVGLTYVPTPAKYEEKHTTDITVVVTSGKGKQEFNIELKSGS